MVTWSSPKFYHVSHLQSDSLCFCPERQWCPRPCFVFCVSQKQCYLSRGGVEADSALTWGVGTILCSTFHPQGDDSREIRLRVLDYRGDLLNQGSPVTSQNVYSFRVCSTGEQIKVMKERWRHIYLIFGNRRIFKNYFIIFIFWPCHSPCRILVPQPEIKPTPLHWEHGVLATTPPGKSWKLMCFQHVPTHQILSTSPQVRWAVTISPLYRWGEKNGRRRVTLIGITAPPN